jgi:protoheme IX farnesyltransferase
MKPSTGEHSLVQIDKLPMVTKLGQKFRVYWPLIKSLQTILLLVTGVAGFMSSRCPWLNLPITLGVAGSLFFAIAGSTVFNMWYDRDIDALMKRTCTRPLPSGKIPPHEALYLGFILSILGVGWALTLDLLYGAIVFAGLFFDVVVYSIWLKRKTAWSIVWGGLAGGMPVLAGRALGIGRIDWVGGMLMVAVLLWIPTHILTFNLRYHEDYKRAKVPTFPSLYGFKATRRIIALSSVGAAIAMGLAAYGIGMTIGYLRVMILLSGGLLFLAVSMMLKPSERLNFRLMLGSMLLMASEAF